MNWKNTEGKKRGYPTFFLYHGIISQATFKSLKDICRIISLPTFMPRAFSFTTNKNNTKQECFHPIVKYILFSS